MAIISFRKKVVRRRRRRLMPRRRLFKTKSLYPRRTIYIHKGRFRLFKHRTQRERFFRRFNSYILPTRKKAYFKAPKKATISKPKRASFTRSVIKKDWSAEKTKWNKVFQSPQYKSFYTPKTGISRTAFEREKKKVRKPKIQKTFKKVENRGGKRDYVWAGKWYGEMKSLSRMIFEVTPTGDFRLYTRLRKKMDDYRTVMANTKSAMEKVLDGLKIYAKVLINKYVPKDTGELRRVMYKSVDESKVERFRMKVVLNTGDLLYANPVNNMPEKKIRHKKWRKQIGRSGKILNDPKASPQWFDTISMLLNTRAKELLHNMVDEIVMAWVYRQRPSGYVHPPVGTKKKRVESEASYRNRQRAFTERGEAYKRIGKMRKRGSAKLPKIPEIVWEEKEVPLIRDRARREAEARERKYKQKYMIIGKFRGEFIQPSVEYPRWLIKDFFKVKGLNKR